VKQFAVITGAILLAAHILAAEFAIFWFVVIASAFGGGSDY
jgi:membrane protein implicated in regulation of membrane protease activity